MSNPRSRAFTSARHAAEVKDHSALHTVCCGVPPDGSSCPYELPVSAETVIIVKGGAVSVRVYGRPPGLTQ